MTVRANESIWRLARFLHKKFNTTWFPIEALQSGFVPNIYDEEFNSEREAWYDKALELYNKLGIVSTIGLDSP